MTKKFMRSVLATILMINIIGSTVSASAGTAV